MGGRIATQVAARPERLPAVPAGIVLLGYPLHPPGKPRQLRATHLSAVQLPMLLMQGTRDPFGTPAEVEPIASRLPDATLHVVDGGDHSFVVPKKYAAGRMDVEPDVQDAIVAWIRGHITGPGGSSSHR